MQENKATVFIQPYKLQSVLVNAENKCVKYNN